MKKMLPVLSLLVLAASVAGAFPGPDSMGIYVDPTDTGPAENCADIAPFVSTNLYLCITNPSGSQVLGWEARVRDTRTPGAMFGSWVVEGIDALTAPDDYAIGLTGAPLTPNAQGVIVLGTMQALLLTSPPAQIDFYIEHIPGSLSFPGMTPGYVHTVGIKTPCRTATGGSGVPFTYNPVFRINGTCIVGNEDASWSQVKTLYR